MGPPSTRVHKRQWVQFFGVAPNQHDSLAKSSSTVAVRPLVNALSTHWSPQTPHLMVMDSFVSVDAPYGDHFSLADRIEMDLLQPVVAGKTPKTRVRISIIARFSRFTMMKCMQFRPRHFSINDS
jgi:hypothetical protein